MKAGWGKRLEQARLRHGRENKTTFPLLVGSNRVSWAKFEAEEVAPNFEIMMRVSKLTGVSLDWIATGTSHAESVLHRSKLETAVTAAMQIVETARTNGRSYSAEEVASFISDIYAGMVKTSIDGLNSYAQDDGVQTEEVHDGRDRKTGA